MRRCRADGSNITKRIHRLQIASSAKLFGNRRAAVLGSPAFEDNFRSRKNPLDRPEAANSFVAAG
jgi:hypothetical protein